MWGHKRPARPSEKVIVQPVEYSGKSFEDKIADLRKELDKKKSLGFVVSMLDEIAWLFNLRGSESVPYFVSMAQVINYKTAFHITQCSFLTPLSHHRQ